LNYTYIPFGYRAQDVLSLRGWAEKAGFTFNFSIKQVGGKEPHAGARGFFYGKSHLYLGTDRPQTHMTIHPCSEERGILAFSRKYAACQPDLTQVALRIPINNP
jgi:hypothetical protein